MKKSKLELEVEIPEDVLVLILCRLPLKALYRSKAVSKSWASLIQQLEIRRPPLFLGLFHRIDSPCADLWQNSIDYMKSEDRIFRCMDTDGGGIHNSSVDPTLSFLPPGQGGDVFDCCNGLVLYRRRSNCFVCNPLTKSWTQLSFRQVRASLDFDPQVSPHFKIVSFTPSNVSQRISVYSSETGRWRKYRAVLDRYYYNQMARDRDYAYWKGHLYLVMSNGVPYNSPGGERKIVRFELEHGEREWYEADCQPTYVEFPAGTEKPPDGCLARGWTDKLCFGGFDWIRNNNNNTEMRVRVWSLSTRDQTVWVMEHDRVVPCSLLRGYNPHNPPVVVGFHPFLDDVVFIMRGSTFYTLDLMKLSLVEVCSIGYGPWELGLATVYPFFPCAVDSLESRNLEEAAAATN